jgi:hypothetical protein
LRHTIGACAGSCNDGAIAAEFLGQRRRELGIDFLRWRLRPGELRRHPASESCCQRRSHFGRDRFERGHQLFDAIRGVRRAHLGEGAASLAVCKRRGDQRRRNDAADQDQKHASLHRCDEPSHGALSFLTSAVKT